MPRGLSDAEKIQIAEYFSSMPFRPWVRVVEAEVVPQVRLTNGRLMIPIEDAPPMPLGQRIIEVPEYPDRMEIMRDPRSGFITYVPVGSLVKGEVLVTTVLHHDVARVLETAADPLYRLIGRTVELSGEVLV